MKKQCCPYYKKCGGCTYQGVDYSEQLQIKQKKVNSLLKGICKVDPILAMKEPKFYRNKVHAVFHRKKDGSIVSGFYEQGTHRVVPVESCLIEDEKSNAIIQDIRGLLRSFKIKVYNEDSGYGLLRHVLIRKGFQTGQIMVVLVLSSPILPSKNNFVKALRKLHPEITTVVLNVNDKKTSMVLGDRNIVLYGKGVIEDTLCGLTFKISPNSFYQVNPVQTELLYNEAIQMANLKGKERIIDAYSGIGTIGMIAGKHAKEVIQIELNANAVRDARENVKRNKMSHVRVFQGDAGEFMRQMAAKGEKADVVFMDPPRAGSDETFMSSVVTLAPQKVVYISCNPETLARDLKYFSKHGYDPKVARPVDMFPYTVHVETVCLLSRENKDSRE